MDKKIGNVVLLVLLFTTSLIGSSLRVSITDVHDNPVQQVEVGVPFFVRISANNMDAQGQPKGFDQWKDISISFAGTSQSTRIINGSRSQSITYQYIATASRKGNLKCAPLTLQDRSGKTVQSDSITISVADSTKLAHDEYEAKPYVLYLQLDQKDFYLGQKISAMLRFGYQRDFSNLQLSQEPLEYFHQGYVQEQPTKGSFEMDGQKYESHDFLIELYPDRVGTLTLPSFRATFVPDISYQRTLSLFAMMSGNSIIESLPRSVQVKQLPVTEYQNVSAIGTFDSVEFSFNAMQAKVGEGLVAKMTITGSGNLPVIKAPVLHLPEGLQYYEGNSSVTRHSDQRSSKEFEWIVQAEHAGTFDIGQQEFVYFDPETKQYHLLHSKPTTLSIQAGTAQVNQKESVEQPIQEKQELSQPLESDVQSPENKTETMIEKIQNLAQQAKVWIQQILLSRNGVIKIVEILVYCLLLLGLIFGIRRFWKRSFFIKTLSIRIRFARACRNQDMHTVYQLFEELMHEYGLSFESLELKKCFEQLQMSQQSFENWKNFVTMIWEMNFAKDRATDEHELAFALAKEWFSVILSCCKLQSKNK